MILKNSISKVQIKNENIEEKELLEFELSRESEKKADKNGKDDY